MCFNYYYYAISTKVLSDSVSKALTLTGGDAVSETAKFVDMFDKFFDCVNVSNFNSAKLQRKPFKQPYRSAKDFRLKVMFINMHDMYDNY